MTTHAESHALARVHKVKYNRMMPTYVANAWISRDRPKRHLIGDIITKRPSDYQPRGVVTRTQSLLLHWQQCAKKKETNTWNSPFFYVWFPSLAMPIVFYFRAIPVVVAPAHFLALPVLAQHGPLVNNAPVPQNSSTCRTKSRAEQKPSRSIQHPNVVCHNRESLSMDR